MTTIATTSQVTTMATKKKPTKRGGNLQTAEQLLLAGNYSQCSNICRLYFSNKAAYANMDNSSPEFIFDKQPEVIDEGILLGAVYLQSLFESGETDTTYGLELLERYMIANAPIPFTLGLLWLTFKVELKQMNEAKTLLEHYLGACAQLINEGKSPTKEMCEQYTALAELFTVRVLPRLGFVSASQSFLAIHNNNVLLSRQERQRLLLAIDENLAIENETNENKINDDNTSEEKEEDIPNATHPVASTPQPSTDHEQKQVQPLTNRKPMGKWDQGPIEGVSWEQTGIAAACGTVLMLAITQRHRIRQGGAFLSKTMSNIGDLIFGP